MIMGAMLFLVFIRVWQRKQKRYRLCL